MSLPASTCKDPHTFSHHKQSPQDDSMTREAVAGEFDGVALWPSKPRQAC